MSLSNMVSFILHAPMHFFGVWCWFLHVCTHTYIHACTHACMSLRGGSGARFPTLIPSSCLPRLRKHNHSFLWFRRVFLPVLPCNQIARNSSISWVIPMYMHVCVYMMSHTHICHQTIMKYTDLHTQIHIPSNFPSSHGVSVCPPVYWQPATLKLPYTFRYLKVGNSNYLQL